MNVILGIRDPTELEPPDDCEPMQPTREKQVVIRGFRKEHNIENVDISDISTNFVFQSETDYHLCM